MSRVRALAGAVAILVGVLAPVLVGAPATAATGACQDPRGVTVVVDLTDLGGGVVVECAGSGGMTGLQALQRAGLVVSGTQRQGLAFICRIDGRPAADEKIALDGRSGYREQCTDTPPPGAYWAYWYADRSGPWVYATSGPAGHEAIAGGYEGWRFELNRTEARPLPPGLDLPATATATTTPPSSAATPEARTSPAPGESANAPTAGSPAATLAVVGGAAVLVAGGGVAAWRRSRTR